MECPANPTIRPRVGPYRTLAEIGRGEWAFAQQNGMMGKKLTAVRRPEARSDNGGTMVQKFAKLFWRERQILAQLDHPNIASCWTRELKPASPNMRWNSSTANRSTGTANSTR